ncbi:flavin reductase [Pseudaminobacter arsenicus]|uniref:Flavin reductase n=2 Tax=Borborobacter arsenicus TaxID=1851146 RepID=A0A432V7J0_9HYPH|nr:flavin reductase [Pseudaminobacter arsenicus]
MSKSRGPKMSTLEATSQVLPPFTAVTTAIPTVDRAAFVSAMSGAVTSVNVVTTDGTGGMFGVTVSAMASVSADPPMLLVCVNQRSPACAAIRENGVFCVNLLAANQHDISDVFAGHPREGEAFDFGCAEWQATTTGAVRLPGAASTFDCVLHSSQDAGTHTIFVGRVVDVTATESAPLAHCRRTYCHPAALPMTN